MKTVMVSGHFDPFHDGHLDYIMQAVQYGELLFCIISTDAQLLMKKGKVNIPEEGRRKIVDNVLWGCKFTHLTSLNYWDTKTPMVVEVLKVWHPDIFFRGYDKTLETMPPEERKVCEELGIEIIHAKNRIGERHSSEIF